MKLSELVQKYWDKKGAEYYSRNRFLDSGKMKRKLIENLRSGISGNVLDFGTGTGLLAGMLCSEGYKNVVGIDINRHMLSKVRGRLEENSPHLVRGDCMTLPFKDSVFDAVVTRWVLWVLPDPFKAVEEMKRVLKPGGEILAFSSGSLREKDPFLKRVMRYPFRRGRSFFMDRKYKREISTEEFWKISEGRLPRLTLEEYENLFKEKGLENVSKSPLERYGTRFSRIFFNSYNFSMIKGRVPEKKIVEKTAGNKSENTEGGYLSMLACPTCRMGVDNPEKDLLVCSACKKEYNIIDGIPEMMPPEEMLF
ncbi:MAG: methyltransferase domain-containing protein [Fibrobacterota bacterium]